MDNLLSFEAVFPGEKALSPEKYMAGGKRHQLLGVAAFFLGFKTDGSKYRNIKELFSDIFSKENIEFAKLVYARILNIEKSVKAPVSIITHFSSLTLFETFFASVDQEEFQSSAEFERNLFKAYLVINSSFLKRQELGLKSVHDAPVSLRPPMVLFCMQYPVTDWTTNCARAMEISNGSTSLQF